MTHPWVGEVLLVSRALPVRRKFVDSDILRLDGDALIKVASLPLPSHPASMRGSTP
jgi:hypothetical protein